MKARYLLLVPGLLRCFDVMCVPLYSGGARIVITCVCGGGGVRPSVLMTTHEHVDGRRPNLVGTGKR